MAAQKQNFLGRMWGRIKAALSYSMDDFDREIRQGIRRGQPVAGVYVSPETALRQATVLSCVRVLAEAMASLPLFLYREQNGRREKATDHPLYYLLHDAPNDEMSAADWMTSQMTSLVPSGNCYTVLTRNGRGEIIDLYPAPWDQVHVYRDPRTNQLRYRVTNERGDQEDLPANRVMHVKLFTRDGVMGQSVIQLAAQHVALGMATTDFLGKFYSQGMTIGAVLEHPETLSEQARENLEKSLQEEALGLSNAWTPFILEEGMKLNRVSMPFKDVQLVEMLKLGRDEICGLFRVPPHMVANLERATFSNVEHLSLEFVMYTLLPYVRMFEQAINQKLLTPRERAAGYYAKFNLSGLLRGDYKSRQEGLAIQRQNGVINADEWRELEEYNPIGGEAGEAYLVNGNMVPTEQAMKGGDASDETA